MKNVRLIKKKSDFLRRGRYKHRGCYIWALYVWLTHNSEPHQSYFILN